MNLIQVNKLNKYYYRKKDNELHVLKDLDLEIKENDMVAIMGVSGCGKSTLLHILGCLDKFDSGLYIYNEHEIQNLNDKKLSDIRASSIGFVLQDFGLIDEDSVLSNVKTPLYFDSNIKLSKFNELAKQALESLNISELAKKKVSHLSGGQKQRVAIARAIVNKPKLILADEPTGSLDSKTSAEIMEILKQLNQQGTTIIIVTHDINIANQCKKIYNMSDGVIVE